MNPPENVKLTTCRPPSVIWVERLIAAEARWLRSPTPVSVNVKMS